MSEFRFLVFVIVILELAIFACGLRVVSNRHNYRALFIQLEKEQQIQHSLNEEKSQLMLEIYNLEQTRQIENKAREKGLAPAQTSQVVILPSSDKKLKR